MRTVTLLVAFAFVIATHEKNSHACTTINRSGYRIVDTTGFYLYSHDQLIQGMKIARPGTAYYFSVAPDSPPIPLTVANLQKAYSQNHAFCYTLSTDFNSDKDLITWIPSLQTFKVKYAYVQ